MANTFGAVSSPGSMHITIDTIPPSITVISPKNGLLTNNRSQVITGNVSETATLTINGVSVSDRGLQFSYTPTLAEGANTFQLKATDQAGNIGTANLTITLDTIPPAAPIAGDIKTSVSSGQVSVTGTAGSVEGGALVTVIDSTSGTQVTVMANAGGGFSATLTGSNSDSLQIYATDAAGNQGTPTGVTVEAGGPFSGAIRFGSVLPSSGTTVVGDWVLIAADLQAPPNTGVTMNGIIAAAAPGPSGTRFYAEVPLQIGSNAITITATSQDGRVVTQSLTIGSTGPFPYRITEDNAVGVSPINVRFQVIDQLGLGVAQVQVDFDNDGVIDFTAANPSSPITSSYTDVGLVQARFVITDSSGISHTEFAPVLLIDPGVVDQSIQAIWNAMNAALSAGDKSGALQYLTPEAQDRLGPVFDALLPRMPSIVQSFSAPQRSFVTAAYAEYGVNRTISGANHVFLVNFVTNQYGQWQLDSM